MSAARRRPRRGARSVAAAVKALFPASRRRKRRVPPVLPPAPVAPAARRAPKAPTRRGSGTWLRQTHPGVAGARSYFVYVPPGIRRDRAVPLVVLLHGCRQTPADFAAATRFNRLADRHGFLVVYPEQAAWHQRHRCWRWYEAAHQSRGLGEPAVLAGITSAVTADRTRWRVDPTRVYVAGLSAGGAMALVLAATYPDLFAAVGVHSAPAYRSARGGQDALAAMAGRTVVPPPRVAGSAGAGPGGMPPTILFHGALDNAVHARNGDRVAEQWLDFHRAHTADPKHPRRIVRHATRKGRAADGRPYAVTRWYTAGGHKMLEYWLVDELGHAWSGGTRGGSFSDPRGPRASTAMWRFFAERRLP